MKKRIVTSQISSNLETSDNQQSLFLTLNLPQIKPAALVSKKRGYTSLTQEDKFNVLRPLLDSESIDEHKMPIIRKTGIEQINWDKLLVQNAQNASMKASNKNTLLLMFQDDKKLDYYWNHPFKKVPLLQSYAAVASPDFSVAPSMNPHQFNHNIFKSRHIGQTWQTCGCTVLPTIAWATPETYDICFSGLERHSIVVISTLGCHSHQHIFLSGFNEMKRRIKPPLIIVFGGMIEGMTGTFLNYQYQDAFSCSSEQLNFNLFPRIFTR